jgi:hypothetical protein
VVRSFLAAAFWAALFVSAASAAPAAPALVPQPRVVQPVPCRSAFALNRPLRFPHGTDPGGFELLSARWTALGIPTPVIVPDRAAADVGFGMAAMDTYQPAGAEPALPGYRLDVSSRIMIMGNSGDGSGDGFFDALMTLAQLPERNGTGWVLPCVQIDDSPAMRWRIVSDDVSRGPFPTMDYAKERIRGLAAFKINGWSPYMEQVVVDPRYPFVAWPNGWTTAQLHELAAYARRFHVTLIPEQQTFAHMHEALKWEALAPMAELPHGYLVAESDPRTYRYLEPLIKSIVAAVKPVPFVHLGADEPIDLGRGRTPRTAQAFADHVTRVAAALAGSGARPMIWDDAVQQDPTILSLIPRPTVVVTFHYGAEKTYRSYIDTVANAGFDQMVAPGAANWNEVYPDLATSYANVARFVGEAKSAHGVLGMFMTVWHDDGETLFEATWPSVAYAAATAWQTKPVDDDTWHATFARAFFGSDDPGYAGDLSTLEAIRPLLRTTPSDPPDYVFWQDPFDAQLQERAKVLDLAGVRERAERVLTHLWSVHPPLHAEAAGVMKLGALRYDQLARRLQIGKEARDSYEDARAHADTPDNPQVYRSLSVAKYLCSELRDGLSNVVPLYVGAWRYESTESGVQHIITRYRVAEDDAQRCADRIDGVIREDYLRHATVPAWDEVMRSPH